MIELMLVRNLSKLMGSKEEKKNYISAPQTVTHDLRLPQATPFGEPVSSVTENTTRTLEYMRRDS